MVRNAPKPYETHQNMSLGSDGMDILDLLQKILTQLCGLNFCINYNSSARFEVSIVKQRNGPKCTQTLWNKTKHEFSVQWGGSGAFVVKNSDTTSWMNFCIICTNSAHFAPSFMQQPNGPKCTQTLRNATKDEFGVQWGWIGCVHCENIWRDFVAWTFAFIAPVQPILHRVSCTNKMDQNAPKHYETHQNMSLRSYGVDRVDLLQKILT